MTTRILQDHEIYQMFMLQGLMLLVHGQFNANRDNDDYKNNVDKWCSDINAWFEQKLDFDKHTAWKIQKDEQLQAMLKIVQNEREKKLLLAETDKEPPKHIDTFFDQAE